MKTRPEWHPDKNPQSTALAVLVFVAAHGFWKGTKPSIRAKLLIKYGLCETAGQVPLHGVCIEGRIGARASPETLIHQSRCATATV